MTSVEKSNQGKHPGTSGSNGMLGAARCAASQGTPRIGPLRSAGRRQQKETRHRCLQHVLQLSKTWRFSGDSWTEVDKRCALHFFTFLLFIFPVNVSFEPGEKGVGMFCFQSHHGEFFPPDESRVNLSLYLPSPPPLLSDWEEARGACCRVALPARRCLDGATHCGARPHTGPQVMFVGVQPDPTPAPRCLVLPRLPFAFGLGFEGRPSIFVESCLPLFPLTEIKTRKFTRENGLKGERGAKLAAEAADRNIKLCQCCELLGLLIGRTGLESPLFATKPLCDSGSD